MTSLLRAPGDGRAARGQMQAERSFMTGVIEGRLCKAFVSRPTESCKARVNVADSAAVPPPAPVVPDDRTLGRLIAGDRSALGYEVLVGAMTRGTEGFAALQQWRRIPTVLVLMLTVCGEEADRIASSVPGG